MILITNYKLQNYKCFQRRSRISGNSLRFEQPEQERIVRDFKLQMLSGRLTRLLQYSRFKN